MAAAAFLTLHSLAHDDVAGVDHVAEFANVHVDLRAEEELLSLFVKDVESGPSTLQAELGTDDADVGLHDLLNFGLRVGDEVEFLLAYAAGIDPVGDVGAISEFIDTGDAVLGCQVGIDDGFDEGVGGKAVAAVQTRA